MLKDNLEDISENSFECFKCALIHNLVKFLCMKCHQCSYRLKTSH